MLGSAVWLTVATLLGLCLGFAREWLLVAAWGAGERSDAFLIALFLPEALRMSLAGGVLSAAALPLYLQRQEGERLSWLAVLFPALLLIALVTSLLLTLLAPWLVQLLGPGLAASATALAGSNLQIVAWCVPGLMLHALFSIPLQASERFVLAWFAVPLVFGAWNALLARYAYAAGDTRQPLRCELLGSLVNVLLLGALPFIFGLAGIPLAALAGVLCTALLLMQRQSLLSALPWARQWLLSTLLLGLAAWLLFRIDGVWLQLGLSTLAGAVVLLGMGLWLKPWRKA